MIKFKFVFVLSFSVFAALLFLLPFSQTSADITTGLVSHYKLDETSGTAATDSFGTNTGTLTNGPIWTTGKLNNALSFDGVNDYVSMGSPSSLDNMETVTYSAWIYRTGNCYVIAGGPYRSIIAHGADYDSNFRFGSDSCQLKFNWRYSGDDVDSKSAASYAIPLNTWKHVAVTYDATGDRKARIYIDGAEVVYLFQVASTGTRQDVSAYNLNIGNNGDENYSRFFPGKIDDVRVYSRALTSADIAQLYALPPIVTTNSATSITSTSATLNGTINPNNQSTSAYFQYGLTSAYGNTTPAQTLTGSANQTITASITGPGLDSNTVYYYRAVAQSSAGITYGTEQTFTTTASLPALSTSAKKTLSSITIDGNLSESVWNLTESINRTISGTNNNTTTFQTLWDDNYLYVAYKVLDSNLINDSVNAYQDDSVELYLDPDNSKSTAYDTYDRQFIKGYNDTTLTAPQNGTGVLHNTTNITGGYTVELAIPWTNLNAIAAANKILGFDLQQNDDDTGGDIQNAMGWNSTTGANYKNTSAFGTLTLSATTVGTLPQSSSSSVSQSSSSLTATDTTPPIISISSPTTNSAYSTSASTVDLSGTASDNIGVTSVTCTNNSSSCGTVSGTTSWSIASVPLAIGTNTITVTARDSSNNSSTDTLTVTRTTTTTSSNQWQKVPLLTKAQQAAGLSGGEGFQMIFDRMYAPSNGNIVYFVNDVSAVWKSVDGGTSWEHKNKGFRSNGGVSVSVNPANPDIVIVAGSTHGTSRTLPLSWHPHGIWRTEDGGNNWTLVDSNANYRRAYGNKLFSWTDANTVYAGTHNDGLYKSTDAGKSWTKLNLTALNGDEISHVYAHPDNKSIIFVVSVTDAKLYKVTGAGAATVQIGAGLSSRPLALAVSGNQNSNYDDDTVYVTIDTVGVYRSIDSGQNFSPRNSGLPSASRSAGGDYYYFFEMSPADNNYLYAAMHERNRGLYYSHDGGATWYYPDSTDEQNKDGWVDGSLANDDYDAGFTYYNKVPSAHPTNKNIVIAEGKNSIKQSIDGGINWRYSGSGYTGGAVGFSQSHSNGSAMAWDKNNPDRFFFFLMDAGFFSTDDGGKTFRSFNVLRNPQTQAKTTIGGAVGYGSAANIIVTAVGSWWENQIIAIGRNINAITPAWQYITETNGFYPFIAFHPSNNNIVYAGRYKFTNIQNDNTYTLLSRHVVTMYPKNGDIVFSVGSPSADVTRIYKSVDAGKTWTNPFPDLSVTYSNNIGDIIADPNNPNKVYVAVRGKGIYILEPGKTKLLDGSAIGYGLGLAKSAIGDQQLHAYHLAIDPENSNVIYAAYYVSYGASEGIFRSIDGGGTFEKISGNLNNMSLSSVYINPHNKYVYVSGGFGTWKLPPPGTVAVTDTTPPAVSISSPTSATTYSTTASTVFLSGSASDSSGLASVTCAVNGSSCGTVSGTTSWSVSNVPLVLGTNTIVITARDSSANGNTSAATLTITRTTTTTSSSSSSAPLPTLTTLANKTLSPITLDGNLSESVWNLTEPINRTISGVNNNTATFSTLWDDAYLYLAAQVLDSNLINDSTYPWQDDSMEIYLDGGHEQSLTYDLNDRQFVQGYNDATLAALQNGTGVLHNTTNITGGYTVEMAIPWSNLGLTPSANMTLGFDLQQNDDDTGGNVQSVKGWNSTTGANYKDTSAFGTLTLSSQTVGTAQSSSSSAASQSSSAQSSVSSPSSSSQSSAAQSSSVSSAKFIIGDRVITTDTLNVRSTASLTGTALGSQSLNQAGTIVSGPVSSGGYNWYNVNYDTAPDGWSVENYLEKVVQSSSSSSAGEAGSSSSSSSYVTQTFQSSTGNIGGSGGGGGGGGSGIYIPPVSYESTLKTIASSTKEKALTSSSTPIVSVIGASSSSQEIQTIFTQDLKIGSRSAQVKTLQEKLAKDKTLYPEGLTTGYYGSLTQAAVKRFQKKHNLAATGSIDLKTRAKLNEIYGQTSAARLPDGQGQASSPQASSTTSPKSPYSSLTETQRQELIKQLQETLKKLLQQLIELLKKQAGR